MTEPLQTALAVLFRKTGSPATADELVRAASLGLNWCKPSQSWNLVARGIHAGLVKEQPDGRLGLQFNPQGETVPLGYAPPPEFFEAAPELVPSEAVETPEDPSDLFETVVRRLVATGMARQAAAAEVNKTHASMGGQVNVEVAGILTLLRHGLDGMDLLDDAKRSIQAQ